jgi:uncharacterized repeat protein (TIGR03803 family)
MEIRVNWALLVALVRVSLAGAAQSPSATLTTLYNFTGGADGSEPCGGLIGDDNALYGTTTYGGAYGLGTVFSLTPSAAGGAWVESVLYSFAGGSDGTYPLGLSIGPGGALYGTTAGTVFSLTPPSAPGGAWSYATLYTFTGGSDGFIVSGAPAIDTSGAIYGPTEFGGTGPCLMGCGTVWALTPPATPGGAWTETVLHSFTGGTDGAYYASSLVIDAHGVLYGTMGQDGAYNAGYVFSFTPPAAPGGAWTETALHNFTGKNGTPPVGLAIDTAGVLYGATTGGGANGGGTIYSLTPPAAAGSTWTFGVLYNVHHYGNNFQQPMASCGEQGRYLRLDAHRLDGRSLI